ncbi:MAG: alpha/beta hydrolase [Alphaproteobacteria bacterium]|nr:alpha/beta hydrolase [Alphaproteobacteria bacterium]
MQISQAVIEAASARIAVRIAGQGPPVLCLHATGHDGRDFDAFASRVGARFRVIALDWPGQGASPADGHAPRAARYADIALGVVEALGLARPIIVGNSIGGAAGVVAAARAPERIGALVLCNAGGLAPVDPIARFVIRRMAGFFAAGARGARWFPAAFRWYYQRLVLPQPAAASRRAEIIAAGCGLAPLLAEAWRGFAEPDADLRACARGLAVPVWCAWARDDRLVSWGRSRAAVRRIPNARWTLFRGGHAAFLEDPDRFAAAFTAFAATLGAGRPAGAPPARPPALQDIP